MTDNARPGTAAVEEPASNRILRNAGFRAIADIGGKVASATLYIVLARKVGPAEYGIYAFALSFVGLVTTAGQFGQDTVLTREVAREPGRLDEYFSSALASRLALSVPPLAIALLVATFAGMSAHERLVIVLLGIGFIADMLLGVVFASFQAFERVAPIPVVLISQRWVTTGAAATALFAGAGIVAVAAIYAIGAVGAVVLGFSLLCRLIARPRLRFDRVRTLAVTREALPIGLAFVAWNILFRVDASMLAIFRPNRDVGLYGAAYKLLETTLFVTWSVNAALLPHFARLSPTSSPPVGRVYQRGLKVVSAITVPLAAGAAVLAGPLILLLYGNSFRAAAEALPLLAPTIFLFPASSMTASLLYTQNRQGLVSKVFACVILENVAGNLLLIPRFGFVGAAAGTSISEILVSSTLLFLSRQLVGALDWRRIASGPVVASIAAAGAMWALRGTLGVAIAAGGAVYVAVLVGIERAAYPDDFTMLVGFLRSGGRRRPSRPTTP